jgi:Tol biopolymer transport system component
VAAHCLRRDGVDVPLPPKVFELLVLLASRAGRLVTKDELMQALWPDTFVDEANLTQNVFTLRKALGDEAKVIETVPRRGYRFNAAALPPATGVQDEPRPAPRRGSFVRWAGAALAITMAATIGVMLFDRGGPRTPEPASGLTVRKVTTTGDVVDAAMSPDARFVAYARNADGKWSMWLHQLATGSTVQIGRDEPAPVTGLTFSADGERLYFLRSDGSLNAIATLGGEPRHVIDGVASPAAVSPDGSRLAFVRWRPDTGERSLLTTDAFGSEPRVLLTRRTPEVIVYQGAGWSPDGRLLAVVVNESFGGSKPQVVVVDVETGRSRVLSSTLPWQAGRVTWHPNGDALTVSAGHLYRVAYPGGEVTQLTREAAGYGQQVWARTGHLMMAVQRDETSAIWVAESGNVSSAREVLTESGYNHGLAWLGNDRLVFESWTSGNMDLWQVGLDGGPPSRLTTHDAIDNFPATGPDDVVVFATARAGGTTIWRRAVDGRDERQVSPDGVQYAPQRSPDGRQVVYHRAHPTRSWTVWRSTIDGTGHVELIERSSTFPVYSPDGRYLACNVLAGPSGWHVAVVPAAGGEPVREITLAGPPTRRLAWGPDGDLYLSAIDAAIWRVARGADRAEMVAQFPEEVVTAIAWSPDGRRMAYVRNRRRDDVVLITP